MVGITSVASHIRIASIAMGTGTEGMMIRDMTLSIQATVTRVPTQTFNTRLTEQTVSMLFTASLCWYW